MPALMLPSSLAGVTENPATQYRGVGSYSKETPSVLQLDG
jgi:hypothetical protein